MRDGGHAAGIAQSSSVKVFQSIGGAVPAAAENAVVTNETIGGPSVAANSVTLLVAQE